MATYGEVVKEKTPEELAKACSIVNVLREREACAKIAESQATHANVNCGCSECCTARSIAEEIRAQPQDFTTVGEMMERE